MIWLVVKGWKSSLRLRKKNCFCINSFNFIWYTDSNDAQIYAFSHCRVFSSRDVLNTPWLQLSPLRLMKMVFHERVWRDARRDRSQRKLNQANRLSFATISMILAMDLWVLWEGILPGWNITWERERELEKESCIYFLSNFILVCGSKTKRTAN